MTDDSQAQQARFWEKYTLLTRGRIDTFHAFEVIIEETTEPKFKATIQAVYDSLRGGNTLSEALGEHPGTFCLSIRELASSAEKSGAWDDILPVIVEGLKDGTFK